MSDDLGERLMRRIERANETLDWIEQRQGPLKPDGYARIETDVQTLRALRGVVLTTAAPVEETTAQSEYDEYAPEFTEALGPPRTFDQLADAFRSRAGLPPVRARASDPHQRRYADPGHQRRPAERDRGDGAAIASATGTAGAHSEIAMQQHNRY